MGRNCSVLISVILLSFTLDKDLIQWIFFFLSAVQWVIYWIVFFLSFQVLLNNYHSVVRNQGSKVDELETEFIKLNRDINGLQEKVTSQINLKVYFSWLCISMLYPDTLNLIVFFLARLKWTTKKLRYYLMILAKLIRKERIWFHKYK